MKNYYEILEVNEKASDEIIKKVYKIKVKKTHPDLFQGDEKVKAEELTKEITEAYDVLSNEQKRKDYDLQLKTEEEYKNNDLKYEDIINSLKAENEYLKQVIISKNNMITTFVNNDLNDIYPPHISNNEYNNQAKTESNYTQPPHNTKRTYFNSTLYDLKQLLFKFFVFFSLLFALLMLFWLFTGNNVFKIIKNGL